MVHVAQVLLCEGPQKLPHPEVDFKAFLAAVQERLSKDKRVFCPIRKQLVDWVDLRSLAKHYGPPGAAGQCHLS